jgi:hypothetical protein
VRRRYIWFAMLLPGTVLCDAAHGGWPETPSLRFRGYS